MSGECTEHFPILVRADDVYGGAVRYECAKCHIHTMAQYSALGDQEQMARKAWDAGEVSFNV